MVSALILPVASANIRRYVLSGLGIDIPGKYPFFGDRPGNRTGFPVPCILRAYIGDSCLEIVEVKIKNVFLPTLCTFSTLATPHELSGQCKKVLFFYIL